MKKMRWSALVSILMLVLSVHAQGHMKVILKDGTVKTYEVKDIDRIEWDEEETPDVPDTPSEEQEGMVDLGLSVKWASCNVGASTPEALGGYYAWGETEEKGEYSWDSYLYGSGKLDYENIGENIAGGKYDVARAKMGGAWRMPTADEQRELLEKCTWTWTTQGKAKGYKVTGPSGKSIFLPAAGYKDEDGTHAVGEDGLYWSSTKHPNGFDWGAYFLQFSDRKYKMENDELYYGYPVRAVYDKDANGK